MTDENKIDPAIPEPPAEEVEPIVGPNDDESDKVDPAIPGPPPSEVEDDNPKKG